MIHQTRRAFFIFTDTATRAQEDYSVLPVPDKALLDDFQIFG